MNPLSIIITDTHLDEDNSDHVYNIFVQAIAVSKSYGLNFVIHAGDHFNNRVSQKLKTLLMFRRIIKLFEVEKMHLYTIAGNHDKTNQEVPDSYLDVYESKYVTVFKGNTDDFIEISTDTRVYFLPFFTDSVYNERLSLIVSGLDESKRNILVTHIGIDGVLDNSGFKNENTLKIGKFQKFDLVVIGHYHNFNKISKKIQYIGSTDPRNYGEDSDKGCMLLSPDLSLIRHKFAFVQYKKIVVTTFDEIEIAALIEQHTEQNTKVRFEFQGDNLELLNLDKKKIEKLGIEVTTVNKTIVEEGLDNEEIITTSLTDSEILKNLLQYCEKNNVNKSKSAKIIKYFK